MRSYDLGIIGGMGSKATSVAFSRILDYTLAKKDQEHINIIILNDAKTPDRTNAIIYKETGIIEVLKDDFDILEQLRVPLALVACNTSHFFIRQMEIPGSIEFIDTIEETTAYLNNTYPEGRYCVLGTTGLVLSDVFSESGGQNRFVYPESSLQDGIMDIISEIKSGADIKESAQKMRKIMEQISRENKDSIFVLACTEISLLRDFLYYEFTCVDCMDAVLVRAIVKSGYRINELPGNYLANIEYFTGE